MMREPFMAGMHYFHKAMQDIKWPASKTEIINQIGDKKIQTDWEVETAMKDLIRNIELEEFNNAAEFYCAYFASL